MNGRTLPAFLVLVFVVVLGAVALPQLFGFFLGIQDASQGASSLVQQAAGRLPLVVFLVVGVSFVVLLASTYRR